MRKDIATDFPGSGLLADHIGDEVNEMMLRVEALRGIAIGNVMITAKDGEFVFRDQTRLLKGAKHPKELPQDLTPQTKYIGRVLQAWEGQVTGRLYIDISPEGALMPMKQIRFKPPAE